jgi:peptidoglycan/LPS O-acetylase OafA/YrhL
MKAAPKPHYEILDALRGVAAIMVLWFHIFEAFATSHIDQIVNHGYLAVDFFFVLSGFVVGYAYDDRWGKMTVRDFFRRRVVRLHPMVVMGSLVGALSFLIQNCLGWGMPGTGFGALLVATLLGMLLIPATPGIEIRGWGEMFPLNGPSWSLFFEYVGNILYALFIRKLPTRALAVLVLAAGCGLAWFAISGPTGDVSAGWTLTGQQFLAGSLRLMFSFTAGLFVSRVFRPTANVRGVFCICSAAIVVLLAAPRVGGERHLWINGVYDIVCCALIFPAIVWAGASGGPGGGFAKKAYRFLGDISYPLYIVHYPFIYLYYTWVKVNGLTFRESLPGAAGVIVGSVLLAWICLKLYDAPVRKILADRFLNSRKS